MSLTTPVMTQNDASFPAENWFLYWKAAPSLWASKLRSFNRQQEIFVPLFWSLHSPSPNVYDFGQYQPETDLAKLESLAKEAGKKLYFILPFGPLPFLPNGGLPGYLSNSFSKDHHGMIQAVLDRDEQVIKMYSFYDQKVFNGFRKFVSTIAQYWDHNKLRSKIIFLESFGQLNEGDRFVSFMQDYSEGFELAFQRFLKQKEDLALFDRLTLQNEFEVLMKDLYTQTAEELLARHWGGKLKMGFLGVGASELCLRSFAKGTSSNTAKNIKVVKDALKWNMIPSSILLNTEEREEIVDLYFQSQLTPAYYHELLDFDNFDGDTAGIRPLVMLNVFLGESIQTLWWNQLRSLLDKHFSLSYRLSNQWDDHLCEDEESFPSEVLFLIDPVLAPSDAKNIIKYFLKGGRLLIDRDSLPLSVYNKIVLFTDENAISVEEVEYIGKISFFKLGEGQCLFFSSQELESSSSEQQIEFWRRIFSIMQLNSLDIESEEGLECNWGFRRSNSHELSFQEIRRLNIFNSTSEKKKFKIQLNRNYALIKVLDQIRVEMNHQKDVIDVYLSAKGKISLDFGLIGDGR